MFIRLSDDGIAELLIAMFWLRCCWSSSGGEVDCLRVAVCGMLFRCCWCISILIIIPTYYYSGIEIPEAWIPTIKKHNSRSTTKRTREGTTFNRRNNEEDRNAPVAANQHAVDGDTWTVGLIA